MKKIMAATLILAMWVIMLPLGSFLLDPGLLILIGLLIVYIGRRLLGRHLKEQISIHFFGGYNGSLLLGQPRCISTGPAQIFAPLCRFISTDRRIAFGI